MDTNNAATPAVAEAAMQSILNETTTATGVITSIQRGKITVDSVEVSARPEFQKAKTLTATLRQVVKTITKYPSAQISNNMQDNLFKVEDFGFDMKEFPREEQRVAFLDVPLNSTKESIEMLLEKNPNACLYKVLSNHPTLTDGQKRAIESPDLPLTLNDIANKQVVKYSEGSVDADGNDVSGDIILDRNGKIQYRSIYFKVTETADIDNRTADPADFYSSPEIAAEVFTALDEPIQQIK